MSRSRERQRGTRSDAQTVAAGAVILSLCASAGFLGRGLLSIDQRFLPDDTYYTLSIARSLFAGHGASVDGVIPTSGFQPLIVLFQLPVFLLSTKPDGLTLGAVLISAVFGAVAAALAGVIVLRETASLRAGLISGTLVALSPATTANALNGLETTLAAVMMLCVIWLLQGSDRQSALPRIVLMGAVAGLSLLARIDSVLLLIPAALWGLRRIGPARTGITALVAAITVAPWVLYCLRFGGPLPESGAAVRQIIDFHMTSGLSSFPQVLTSLSSALGRFVLPDVPVVGTIVIVAALAFPLAACLRQPRLSLSVVLALSAVSFIALYTFYLPAYWFFDRYLSPVFVFCAMLLSLVGHAALSGPDCSRRSAVPLAGGLAVLMVALAQVWELSRTAEDRPDRGYARYAIQILDQLPEGTTLAAMQSGALTWWAGAPQYAEAGLRVVNLDGVVNGDAKRAIEDRRLAQYLRSVGATHFADWPLNVRMLETYSGQAAPPILGEKIFSSPPYEGFDLYRINAAPSS
ncbi:hypothetical protein [Maritimibacter alkaliphilus]|uniref:hypothetical protein n=1 Tax=Maritimibacter alkaliphilus TaxID=404236 RepID=UPI001C97BD1D|nr:hypothetical protein [Maritimibacter alkaliphilus]MBY6089086.1 glycosyltransferase family 39 protein [Maritimibacter alkaliphilus]